MLSLPAGRQGLILSGALNPDFKIAVWRRRTYQCSNGKIMDNRVIKSLLFLVLTSLFVSSGPGAVSVQRDSGVRKEF
jgi:hypothetical protein